VCMCVCVCVCDVCVMCVFVCDDKQRFGTLIHNTKERRGTRNTNRKKRSRSIRSR